VTPDEARALERGTKIRIKRPHPFAGTETTVTIVREDWPQPPRVCTRAGMAFKPEQIELVPVRVERDEPIQITDEMVAAARRQIEGPEV
jgi:hypothetical protein